MEDINNDLDRDEWDDEEGEEIIDLGDDIQPFSMSFKPEKPNDNKAMFLNIDYEK